ncbi:MAG: aminotransferase class V-fold PLP-dependent enzyme [Thermomicrobia bacterium]|nr:aminotransferase class V-fold PLP-dependent enzyme [Thermomicrobia bacterium]MCA1725304.1 aminotransferase class V-fold PLP-dependent enzyme [Thermomicrobia bacterium]
MSVVENAASLDAVREREFPIVRECTYLNGASQGPWPTRTVEAVQQVVEACQVPHLPKATALPPYEQIARERLARLIGAEPGDIVFTSNTTHGMNIAVQGIAWREGDNIVLPHREFPSLSYAMLHLKERGVEVRFVPFLGAGPSVDELMAHVDSRTRAIACSAIMWDTGYRADLETLGARCAERGCLLIVDGIQIVGAGQLDVKAARVSTLATHGYKWLLSGFGVGALYVAPEAVDRIAPTFIGSQSVDAVADTFDGQLNWKLGAARYQAGGGNRIGWAALATSLGLIEEVGIDAIAARNHALAEYLYAGLTRKESVEIVSSPDPAHRAQIIAFTLGSKERDAAMVKELEEQGIILALRPLGLRASPNFYNTEAEVDRLLAALPD